jgi:pyridoxamine 5'-phosphate oxidase
MHKSLANIRNEYKKSTLSRKNVRSNPVDQFLLWFEEAKIAEVPEVNAMSLATCNARGLPSLRIVLLKSVENGKFTFFTNYQSRKGKELDENPHAALNFFWPPLERQVRIEGTVERVDEQTATTYFQSRPRESQIGAWASPQSAVINSRDLLENRKQQIETRFADATNLPKPKQWGGYAVKPCLVEFWQGRPGRLHDRILYTLDEKDWKINRLAP